MTGPCTRRIRIDGLTHQRTDVRRFADAAIERTFKATTISQAEIMPTSARCKSPARGPSD
jgi:hypothetical protein